MKCIRCDADSDYKDRTDKKCPKCGGTYAFEPKAGDPFTDVAFQKAIAHVSSDGAVRWGVEHLYYELCRKKRLPGYLITILVMAAIMIGLLAVTVGAVVNPVFFVGLAPAAVLAVAAYWVHGASKVVQIERGKFSEMYDRWITVHGPPARVITRKPKPAAPKPVEADVGDYSFDRAVICDRARTVDLLLANNFHFENNCAVLSAEGYPEGPFETVRAMLRRNPKLRVYILHDATPGGCGLAHRLATDPAWFGGKIKVIDVGLRPSHAPRFPGLWLPPAGVASATDGVSADEAGWLSSYSLEVAAVLPEQVLKRLFKAINLQIDLDKYTGPVIYLASRNKSDSGGAGGDGSVISLDAGDSDGPADSFG